MRPAFTEVTDTPLYWKSVSNWILALKKQSSASLLFGQWSYGQIQSLSHKKWQQKLTDR